MATTSLSIFSSYPYEPLYSPSDPSTPIAHHKPLIPYLSDNPHPLQSLSFYLPYTSSIPSPSYLPTDNNNKTYILYIHGGAWRDPLISSTSIQPTISSLFSSPSLPTNLSGIISLNYRLSPHPSHPDIIPPNKAKHPDHISDILSALKFLHQLGISPRIIIGHSCGATLAFQSVMNPSRFGLSPSLEVKNKPEVIIGVNGLYDLAGFIESPPKGFEGLKGGYQEFVEGAFGESKKIWKEVCPTSCEKGWVKEWNEGKKVVLVQSEEDGLVPREQLVGFRKRIEEEEEGGLEVGEVDGEGWGEHDDVWKNGKKLAGLVREVLKGLE
ncbi:Alpha/Beta hydrolase protein [Podospora fimiseda]|uniref:Kynurenine formamidase n=1 Tax=Podospora fimiseda TaxID=252190 RepID=A0AAN7BRQ2_9PEZI|nr:Alpha/Beta hydrolase protein [Podospora fimiseda]